MNLYRRVAKKEGARAALVAAIVGSLNAKMTQGNALFRF